MSNEQDIEDVDIMCSAAVALRALTLYGVWLLSTKTSRRDVIHWIKNNNLWSFLSPEELVFVESNPLKQKQIINFSWQCERLHVLFWALGTVDELAPANKLCDTSAIIKLLTPMNNETAKSFLQTAKLRDEIELWDAAGEIENLHWEARNAKIHNCQPGKSVDIEIIAERHHAINWILWGNEEEWDDVATDT